MNKLSKITIAAGHNRIPNKGAVGILEEDKCTKETAIELNGILLERGIEVYDITPYNRKFVDLASALHAESEAVNRIMPNLHICIHYNASGNGGFGTEVLVYGPKSDAYPIARNVLDEIVSAIGTKSRGVKARPDLHILNATKCPTILTEGLFVDHPDDAKKYDPKKIAQAIADGVLGSEEFMIEKNPIMGDSIISANTLAKFLLSKNSDPKIMLPSLQLAELFISEGKKEGIRGDIAFCQSMHETGNFRYGGLVLPEQNNYCGLGATNDSAVGKGAWFNTPQLGVRAQIQHLKAYCSKEKLNQDLVDPRFDLVTRGSAPNWEDLAGKWAWPGFNKSMYPTLQDAMKHTASYGQTIIKIYKDVLKIADSDIKDNPSDWHKIAWEWGISNGITDGSNPKGPATREMVLQMIYNILSQS